MNHLVYISSSGCGVVEGTFQQITIPQEDVRLQSIPASGAVAAASPRHEPNGDTHGNPKRLTLQPHTLNPSSVVVFSRRRREVPGGAYQRWGQGANCFPHNPQAPIHTRILQTRAVTTE